MGKCSSCGHSTDSGCNATEICDNTDSQWEPKPEAITGDNIEREIQDIYSDKLEANPTTDKSRLTGDTMLPITSFGTDQYPTEEEKEAPIKNHKEAMPLEKMLQAIVHAVVDYQGLPPYTEIWAVREICSAIKDAKEEGTCQTKK